MSNEPTKILLRGQGIGDIDLSLVEKRAEEIARADGRGVPNEVDLEHALEELSGPDIPMAPEVVPGTEELVAWDDSPSDHGVHAPNLEPEDAVNVVEELFIQGSEEADHDRRIAATSKRLDWA